MSLAGLSDDELLAEYRRLAGAARSAVVEELFSRHYDRVARWCYRITGERDAAADLAQDVFLKAHRHLDSFKGASRFTTWLYSIARNESLTRVRRMEPRSDPDSVLSEVPAEQPAPDQVVEQLARAGRLGRFLSDTLDETERAVFTLHYGDEMPLATITRLLRLENASGAKAYIVSSRRKLARAVQRMRARGEEL
jgi:RNA polymerase sigma-70 factor (ECF subfamily)